MGLSFQGALNYVIEEDQKKLLEQKRQDAKEQTIMSLYSGGKLGGFSTRSGGAKKSTSSIGGNRAYLKKNYGLSDEVLAPFIASGDAQGLEDLKTILSNQKEKYKAAGLDLPESVVQEVIEGSVIEQPKDEPLDFKRLEDYIGREMDIMYKEALQAGRTTTGEIIPHDPGFTEIPKLTEIPVVMQAAVNDVSGGARRERSIILKRKAELQELMRTDNSGIYQNEFKVLTDRYNSIESALKNVKDDPSQIIYLYGNSYAKKLFSSDAGQLIKNLPLPSILTDAMANKPMVDSIEMGMILLDLKVFENNTIVRLPTGQEVELIRGPSPTQ